METSMGKRFLNGAAGRSFLVALLFFTISFGFMSCEQMRGSSGSDGADGVNGVDGRDGVDGKDSTADISACYDNSTGFSIQGSVVDNNGVGIAGAVVHLGSNGIKAATTSEAGIYLFCGLEGSKWKDNDQNGIWSSGDTIVGTYTLSAVVKDENHNTTAVIRDAMVGITMNAEKGLSEDRFNVGPVVAGNGVIDTLFECTGTVNNIDTESGTLYPVDLDGDGVIGQDGTCAKSTTVSSNTDEAVSEDRNGNGLLDIFTGEAKAVNAGTDNYDFIIPENSSSLTGTILDAATLKPVEGATVSLERVQEDGISSEMQYGCLLEGQDVDAWISNTFSVAYQSALSGKTGGFTLPGLVSVDKNCDGNYDFYNHITVSAPGYVTVQFRSSDEVLPRKVYSLGHFNSDFPGEEEAGILYMTKTLPAADSTAPYITSVRFGSTNIIDGHITETVPNSIYFQFNEGLRRNLDNIVQNDVIINVGFAGGDYTESSFDMGEGFAARISYEESVTGSGVYDTLVLTPQIPLEPGFRFAVDLTGGIGSVDIKDLAGNDYLGWIDSNSNEIFDNHEADGSQSGEALDVLNYIGFSTFGVFDFYIFQETGVYSAPTVLASNADTGNVSMIETAENTYIDWNPVLDSNSNPAYGYRIWGQAVDTSLATERTVGPFVEIGEVGLSYDPDTEYTWNPGDFWSNWEDAVNDSNTEGAFARYSLENEIEGLDPWTTFIMNVKVGPIDINNLEGNQSNAVRIEDNTPPRFGEPALTAASRNYPFARVSLNGLAPNISDTTTAGGYTDSASSEGDFALLAERDEFRENDTSTRHTISLKTSEPLAKESVNVDSNEDGISDNIALQDIHSDPYFITDLSSADEALYYTETAAIAPLNDDEAVSSPAGNTVDYGSSDSFSNWPGVDVNIDSDAQAALKYQVLTLGITDIFDIRTGLGVLLKPGITDLHGNAVPSNQKAAYLVDGIPPLVKEIEIDSSSDYIEVTFTEPVDPETIISGLALSGGLVADENNPNIPDASGYTKLFNADGDATAYLIDETQTRVRVYVTDTSLIAFDKDGTPLLSNTTVADLAPDVIRYDGESNITGANTVSDDMNAADDGTYLDAYAAENGDIYGLAGYVSTVQPRLVPTVPGTPAAISTSGASIHNGDMVFGPDTVTVNYTKPMNDSLDMYQDDFDTSICNPANYAVTYNTGQSANGDAAITSSAISQVACTSDTSVTLTLKKSITSGELNISGNIAFMDVTYGGTIDDFTPLDAFGAVQLNGFEIDTSQLRKDGQPSEALTGVQALHYIEDGDIIGDTSDSYFSNVPQLRIKVKLLVSDNSDGNSFELETANTADFAGSIVNFDLYTIPGGYQLASISSPATATPLGEGEWTEVTLSLYKSAVGTQTPVYGAVDGDTITFTYATSTTDFDEDAISVADVTTPAVTVLGVVDAQGNTLDTRNNRAVYTWIPFTEQTLDEEDTGVDISAGFHSLRRNR